MSLNRMHLTWQSDLHNSIHIEDNRHGGKTIVENTVKLSTLNRLQNLIDVLQIRCLLIQNVPSAVTTYL
jgi:hypothetical protein